MIQVTDALGQTTRISRDDDGLPRLVESRDAQGVLVQRQTTGFDKRHRTTQQADNDVTDAAAPPLAATFHWDFESNLEQAIDPNRHATTYQYDAVDRLWKSIDALEGVTQWQWDNSDNVTQVTAPNAAATQFTFDDPAHRPTLESSPDRGPVGVGYDADGRLATQTHDNGATLDWSYDALDRLLTETQTLPGQAAVAVRYTYDSCRLGKLCTIDDGTEHVAFAYNGFGQLETETHSQDGKSVQTGYGYDDAGRLQQLTLPSGRVIQTQRDELGRIVHMAADLNGQPQTILEQIGYRADGQFDRLQYGNGSVEQRGYDGYGRLSRQTLTQSNGQVLQQADYQRDANGNLTQRKSEGLAQFPALTASYRYDALDRLTQERYDLTPERNADYTFDANGNRLTRQQGVNGTEGDEIYRYAAKSNRLVDKDALRQADALPEPVKDVTYDAKQRVRTLSVGGRLKAEYRYDARNLRTKKTLYDEAWAVSAEVYYHYDANGLLIGESDAQGQVRREYVYLGMMPVAQIDIDAQGQESVVYFLTDQLATPRLGIDQGQAVVWKWESDAYGSIAPNGSATVNLRFAGQYFDAESGWYYNWNRYYLPKEGRYLSSDPIGLGGGLNTYAYVRNNPINWFDQSGLICRAGSEDCSLDTPGAIGPLGPGPNTDICLADDGTSCPHDSPNAITPIDAAINSPEAIPAGKAVSVGGRVAAAAARAAVNGASKLYKRLKSCPLDWSIIPNKGRYKGQSRYDHVRLHNVDNPNKPSHGVFYGDGVDITNKAWDKAQQLGLEPDVNGNLFVPMDNLTGRAGGQAADSGDLYYGVQIVVVPGTNKLITSYPSN